ncbi:MAG: rod shape-determining protein MreD [Bacteroidales bacterium]|nr:rod shape-determining protein MreD [Candidatus Physcousia equi]
MLIENFKRIMQMALLFAVQILFMNHIHLAGYGTPLVYAALLVYFPAGSGRVGVLLWSFVLATLVDMFSGTPGLSAASLLVAAFFQPKLLQRLMPKDAIEDMHPTYATMGRWNHIRYFTMLLFIHHFLFFLLQSFSFYNLVDLSLSASISFGLSWMVIAITELMRK